MWSVCLISISYNLPRIHTSFASSMSRDMARLFDLDIRRGKQKSRCWWVWYKAKRCSSVELQHPLSWQNLWSATILGIRMRHVISGWSKNGDDMKTNGSVQRLCFLVTPGSDFRRASVSFSEEYSTWSSPPKNSDRKSMKLGLIECGGTFQTENSEHKFDMCWRCLKYFEMTSNMWYHP